MSEAATPVARHCLPLGDGFLTFWGTGEYRNHGYAQAVAKRRAGPAGAHELGRSGGGAAGQVETVFNNAMETLAEEDQALPQVADGGRGSWRKPPRCRDRR